jgi:hypothetical protein
MNIAIICRQAIYERLSKPITSQNPDVTVSPALFQWQAALNYLQTNKVDGIVLEEGVTFFEQIRSMPLPLLIYTSNNEYFKKVNKWIQSLRVELEKRDTHHRKEPPKKVESPTIPKHEKVKEGVKVLLVSNTKELIDFIPAINQVNVVKITSNPQLVFNEEERMGAEVILIEEGVFGQEATTIRELKLLQIIEELKDSNVRVALPLFKRENKKFTSRLIDKGFFNFIVGNDLVATDLEKLIKEPFTKDDVNTHYQSIYVDEEEQLKAIELLQRTEHMVKIFDNADNDVVNEAKDEKEQHPNDESGYIDKEASNHLTINTPEEQYIEKADTLNDEKPVNQRPIKPKIHFVLSKQKRETKIAPIESNSEHPERHDEQRSATLENIAVTFKKMPNIFGLFSKKEGTKKTELQNSETPQNSSNDEDFISRNVFVEGVPHRLVIYSPKGGSNATTVAIQLAESSKNNAVGVVELAYSYGQIAGRLDIQPRFTLNDLEDGMEEYAICKEKYLLAPWLYPVKRPFNENILMEWLGRAQRAFSGRTIIADLQSQSSPLIQYYSMKWATRVIWTVQDTKEHLGMADLQMAQLKKMGDNEWQKIGILVQEITGEKLPWEEVLGVPVIGVLPKERLSRKWKNGLHSSVARHLGLSTSVSGAKGVLGKLL